MPKPSVEVATDAIQLRDVDSVQRLLEVAVRDTLAQENSTQRSRTLGYLASMALRALEVGDFEERLTALEQVVGNRN